VRRAIALAVGLILLGATLVAAAPKPPAALPACTAPRIVIVKHLAELTLICAEGERRYPVTFGASPIGPKRRRGDERTPEGTYRISARIKSDRFHRFLKLSYPDAEDRRRAARAGVDPGGGIGIHGVRASLAGIARLFIRGAGGISAKSWGPTDGCIGMTNEDVEQVFDAVGVGTIVTVEP
jgi:murein L,D-transpeptidase YafK